MIARTFCTLIVILGLAAASVSAADRACALITRGEASAAVGGAVSQGMAAAGQSGDHLCRYSAPRQGMLVIAFVEQNGRDRYQKEKAKIQGDHAPAVENVSGLGDEAVLATVSKGVSELVAVKGDKSVVIVLSGHTAIPSKETMKDLARKALARL